MSIIEIDLMNYREVLKNEEDQKMYLKHVINGFSLNGSGSILYDEEKNSFLLGQSSNENND